MTYGMKSRVHSRAFPEGFGASCAGPEGSRK